MNAAALFRSTFGKEPAQRARSPGRVNLVGGHVDYLGGPVLPIAIDRTIEVAGSPTDADQGECTVVSKVDGELRRGRFDLRRTEPLDESESAEAAWLNYVLGVVAGYRERGIEVPAFDLAIDADLPSGAGLSSSAALETAVALFVEQLTGTRLEVLERAQLCQRAEHRFAGVPCGLLDQLAVGAARAGQALRIDCRDLQLDWVPLPEDLVVVVANTGVKHALGDSEYKKRRETCERACRELGLGSLRELEEAPSTLDPVAFKRVRHAVTEMARVDAFCAALRDGELERLPQLLRASHNSLRDDYEVSCPELDLLVDAAYSFAAENPEFGAQFFGARMTGGGFGGCTINLLRSDAVGPLAARLEHRFEAATGSALNWFQTVAVDAAG